MALSKQNGCQQFDVKKISSCSKVKQISIYEIVDVYNQQQQSLKQNVAAVQMKNINDYLSHHIKPDTVIQSHCHPSKSPNLHITSIHR